MKVFLPLIFGTVLIACDYVTRKYHCRNNIKKLLETFGVLHGVGLALIGWLESGLALIVFFIGWIESG